MDLEMKVIKRDGSLQQISFDKILNRLKNLGKKELLVNYASLVVKVVDRLHDKIHTKQIDELTAQQCASLITTHTDYGVLASRIVISNNHKLTNSNFFQTMILLYSQKSPLPNPQSKITSSFLISIIFVS